jgi:hypothetical protein
MQDHPGDNGSAARNILLLALLSAGLYLGLALTGDLRDRVAVLLASHAVLLAGMGLAWRAMRGRASRFGPVLLAALAFRVLAAVGEPALSDDVYRYVWDGRVQLEGVHPYRHAPDDLALEFLRDGGWAKINHRELRTIYPPLAQLLFLTLAATGAGPVGFKLALGVLDFGVVLALDFLLRALGLPRDRLILYAWNPLAVLETAGSGHVEPLGVGLAVLAAGWIIGRRPGLSTLALAGAVQAKLLPLVLVPGYVRRLRLGELALLALALGAIALPYALTGPALGGGVVDYAARWESNSSVYGALERAFEALGSGEELRPAIAWVREVSGAEWIPWEVVYRWAWPAALARVVVGLLLVGWIAWVAFRPRVDAARESFLVLAGALLLSPTLHPWYALWVLPFAAAYASLPWIAFSSLVPLVYLGGSAGPPGWVPWLEYGALLVVAGVVALARRRRRQTGRGRTVSGYTGRRRGEPES